MDKGKKNRSGNQSNGNGKNENTDDRGRKQLPGAPVSSNRNTKQTPRERSSHGAEKNTTKKGSNNI